MKKLILAIAAITGLATTEAAAGIYKLDVTVTDPGGIGFSQPVFRFTNLSSGVQQIGDLSVSNGPGSWDWVYSATTPATDPYRMIEPAGATRTLLSGEEWNGVGVIDNGGPALIRYGFAGFDPSEFFQFSADPERAGGTPDVIDVRQFMTNDQMTIGVSFVGGPTLTGSDWTAELIDPNGGSGASNQLYRLTLQQSFDDPSSAAPEPASWALMIGGFGLTGGALRRRRALA